MTRMISRSVQELIGVFHVRNTLAAYELSLEREEVVDISENKCIVCPSNVDTSQRVSRNSQGNEFSSNNGGKGVNFESVSEPLPGRVETNPGIRFMGTGLKN